MAHEAVAAAGTAVAGATAAPAIENSAAAAADRIASAQVTLPLRALLIRFGFEILLRLLELRNNTALVICFVSNTCAQLWF